MSGKTLTFHAFFVHQRIWFCPISHRNIYLMDLFMIISFMIIFCFVFSFAVLFTVSGVHILYTLYTHCVHHCNIHCQPACQPVRFECWLYRMCQYLQNHQSKIPSENMFKTYVRRGWKLSFYSLTIESINVNAVERKNDV